MTKLSWFGVGATILYFSGLTYLVSTNWDGFRALTPNEWGDFLAGSLGPLAIFWVVLGFFQQGTELKNSVATLELQAKELANSVEQQRELVHVTRETLEHEREVIESSRLIEKKKLQPKLLLQFGAWIRNGNDHYKYSLRVLNSGASISGFDFTVNKGNESFIFLKKDYFGQGDTVEARRDEVAPRIVKGFTGTARFIDRDGDAYEEEYEFLEREEDGDWPRFIAKRRSHTSLDGQA